MRESLPLALAHGRGPPVRPRELSRMPTATLKKRLWKCGHVFRDGTPCGYEWFSWDNRKPKLCPNCKQRAATWDSRLVELEGFRCALCDHKWTTRDGKEPARCARCKRTDWNNPSARALKGRRKARTAGRG